MKKFLLGENITGEASCGHKGKSCEFYAIVKRGHEECGDSIAAYCNDRIVLAVFDGISGEAGAGHASSQAAKGILDYLKTRKATETTLRDAILYANQQIRFGYTTAAIVSIEKDGSILLAGVGDSPIYSISKGKTSLEIPLGRAVKKGDSILKFFQFRNLVTSVMGPHDSEIELKIKTGRITKGDIIIMASDGLTDNLYVKTKEGYVTDATGTADLKELVGKTTKPQTIVKKLVKEIEKRIKKGKIQNKNRILFPKTDDLTIIALRWL